MRSGAVPTAGAVATVCALVLGLAGAGGAESVTDKYSRKSNTKAKTINVKRDGDSVCFDPSLKFGNIIIVGGRCYTFYVVHGMEGTFLGFGPGGAPIVPSGRLVRLNTPEGSKHKGQLLYTLPVPGEYVALPLGSMQHVKVNFTVLRATSTLILRVPRTAGVTGREFEVPLVR